MIKRALSVLLLSAIAVTVSAETSAHLKIATKLHLKNGNSVGLPAGTEVFVLRQEADQIVVRFRSISGTIYFADTDYVSDAKLKVAPAQAVEVNHSDSAAKTSAVIGKVNKPSAPSNAPSIPALTINPLDRQPTTNYAKLVQKAKINEAKHRDALVDTVNEVSDAAGK